MVLDARRNAVAVEEELAIQAKDTAYAHFTTLVAGKGETMVRFSILYSKKYISFLRYFFSLSVKGKCEGAKLEHESTWKRIVCTFEKLPLGDFDTTLAESF